MTQQPTPREQSMYDLVGGGEAFQRLVGHFYAGVAQDPVLRPLYPDEDLAAAADRLRMFLEQYWGGPRSYSEQRGHPRLRMRHVAFRVDVAARDAWLHHMRAALDELRLPAEQDRVMWDYFVMAANSLLNADDEPAGPAFRAKPAGPALGIHPVGQADSGA